MTDDLIARLRSVDVSWSETGEWCAEAADRIETLEAENERLREALWEIEMFTNGYGDVAGIVHKMAGDTRRAALEARHD